MTEQEIKNISKVLNNTAYVDAEQKINQVNDFAKMIESTNPGFNKDRFWDSCWGKPYENCLPTIEQEVKNEIEEILNSHDFYIENNIRNQILIISCSTDNDDILDLVKNETCIALWNATDEIEQVTGKGFIYDANSAEVNDGKITFQISIF